jgi:hypothetical protein
MATEDGPGLSYSSEAGRWVLAILEASFRPADRARAIGAWLGLSGVAIAAGR